MKRNSRIKLTFVKIVMIRIIFVLLFVSNALALLTADKPYYDLSDAKNLFSDFIQKYDKKYKSQEEYNKRLEIFKNKLIQINELNKVHDATFGVTKFSDLTFEEFASTRLSVIASKDTNVTEKISVNREWILNAPKSLDYRTQNLVTHVRDQGTCKASRVFSAIGNIEGQYAKKHKKLLTLSEQQILDCVKSAAVCQGYSLINVLKGASRLDGCVSEEDYPYTGEAASCRTTSKSKVKVQGAQVLQIRTEDELLGATAHYGPLATVISMLSSAESYRGGVWSPTDCDCGYTNHGVLVVGYGTDTQSGKDYWILKNSWGSNWGESGYVRLERGKNLCGIGSFTATAFVE